jgi:LPXTG-motif cell wall-anchored protein
MYLQTEPVAVATDVSPNMTLAIIGIIAIVGILGLFALFGSNKKCEPS